MRARVVGLFVALLGASMAMATARADDGEVRAALRADWKQLPLAYAAAHVIARDGRGELLGKRDRKLAPGEAPLAAVVLGERKGETLVGVEAEGGAARLALWVDELRSVAVSLTQLATGDEWPARAEGEGVFLETGALVEVLKHDGPLVQVRTLGPIVATGRVPIVAIDTIVKPRPLVKKLPMASVNGTVEDVTGAVLARIDGSVARRALGPHRDELRTENVRVVGAFRPATTKPAPVKKPPAPVVAKARRSTEKLPVGACLYSPGGELVGETKKPMFVPTARDEIYVTELRLVVKVVAKRAADGKSWEMCGIKK